jgi:hypothetical protein
MPRYVIQADAWIALNAASYEDMTRRAYASLLQDELGHRGPAHRALSIMLTGTITPTTALTTTTTVDTAAASKSSSKSSTAVVAKSKSSSATVGANGRSATVGSAVTAMSVIGGVVAKQVLSSVTQAAEAVKRSASKATADSDDSSDDDSAHLDAIHVATSANNTAGHSSISTAIVTAAPTTAAAVAGSKQSKRARKRQRNVGNTWRDRLAWKFARQDLREAAKKEARDSVVKKFAQQEETVENNRYTEVSHISSACCLSTDQCFCTCAQCLVYSMLVSTVTV